MLHAKIEEQQAFRMPCEPQNFGPVNTAFLMSEVVNITSPLELLQASMGQFLLGLDDEHPMDKLLPIQVLSSKDTPQSADSMAN